MHYWPCVASCWTCSHWLTCRRPPMGPLNHPPPCCRWGRDLPTFPWSCPRRSIWIVDIKHKSVSRVIIPQFKRFVGKMLKTCFSYRDVMISSHTFTGSTLGSGYRSVHNLMSRLRPLTDTNEWNTITDREWDKHFFIQSITKTVAEK